MQLNSAKDLDVYKKAYQLAMTIFRVSKTFPDSMIKNPDPFLTR